MSWERFPDIAIFDMAQPGMTFDQGRFFYYTEPYPYNWPDISHPTSGWTGTFPASGLPWSGASPSGGAWAPTVQLSGTWTASVPTSGVWASGANPSPGWTAVPHGGTPLAPTYVPPPGAWTPSMPSGGGWTAKATAAGTWTKTW